MSVRDYPVVAVDQGGNAMIDQALVRRLKEAGFVVADAAQGASARVDYQDRLDDGFVLILKIDFRDAETNVLLATGQIYVPPLKRRPETLIVKEVLEGILGTAAP